MQVLKVALSLMLITVLCPYCTKTVEKKPDSPITPHLVLRAQDHLKLLAGHHAVEYIYNPYTKTWGLLFHTTYDRQPPDEKEKEQFWNTSFELKAQFAYYDVLQKQWGSWDVITYKVHFLYNESGPGGDYMTYTYKKDHPIFQ